MKSDALFINCPFDSTYKPMLNALLFAARFYGLKVNIASFDTDSKSNRLERIIELMKDSKYSIHDLSKLRSEKRREFYRMNMPFELGLDYGIGGNEKVFLIFENEPYKLKIALSDINGWDVRPHHNNPEDLIMEFRQMDCYDELQLKGWSLLVKYNVDSEITIPLVLQPVDKDVRGMYIDK